MELREWREGDLEMLKGWADRDPLVAAQVGANGRSPSEATLDASMPERGVVEASGDPVAVFGMQRFGTGVAVVYVLGSPDHRTFKEQSKAYDVALAVARERGVVVVLGLVSADNKASQLMALRKGFQVVPQVILVKEL